jgi:hypothetical protein
VIPPEEKHDLEISTGGCWAFVALILLGTAFFIIGGIAFFYAIFK